jgi:ATP-dependent Clp protease ATP-binding subunit ClpA
MFERFTQDARRALFFSRHEAHQLGSQSIETEHLLLGILREPKPFIAHLLETAGVTADRLRRRISERVGVQAPAAEYSIEITFSTDVKQVIRLANDESDSLEHYVGTEHLLIGLLDLKRGLAANFLNEHGLTLAPLRDAIANHLKAARRPESPREVSTSGVHPRDLDQAQPPPVTYILTALDGPYPGRRAVSDDTETPAPFAARRAMNVITDMRDQSLRDTSALGPIAMRGITLSQFALVLEAFFERRVVDHTGLTGGFDIELQGTYARDRLRAALRDQLGLILTAST